MLLELAVAAGCDAIVTHNRRDFGAARQFGIRVLSPAEFLGELGGVL
jgi:predicted nucleic acid-binding protein